MDAHEILDDASAVLADVKAQRDKWRSRLNDSYRAGMWRLSILASGVTAIVAFLVAAWDSNEFAAAAIFAIVCGTAVFALVHGVRWVIDGFRKM